MPLLHPQVPHVSISLWSPENDRNSEKTVSNVDYFNLCNDVFHLSMNLFNKYLWRPTRVQHYIKFGGSRRTLASLLLSSSSWPVGLSAILI